MKNLRFRLWIVSLMALLTMSSAAKDFNYNGISYTTVDGTININGTKYNKVKIKSLAFTNFTATTISISSTFTYSGSNYVPVSVAKEAFKGNTRLTQVTFKGKFICEIGESAFQDCTKLATVTLTDDKTNEWNRLKIQKNAFSGCTALTTIMLPYHTKAIGEAAFSGCTKLSNIGSMGDDVSGAVLEEVGASAFENCSQITAIKLEDGIKKIGKRAFYHCSNLVFFYSCFVQLTSIGDQAFEGCAKLEDVFLSSDLSLGTNVFKGCTGLQSVYTVYNSDYTSIPEGTFSGCTSLSAIYSFATTWENNGVLPKKIKTIGKNAFYNCGKITRVVLPPALTTIGDNAFYFCQELRSVHSFTDKDDKNLNNLQTIGSSAFYYCKKLDLDGTMIPNLKNLKTIGNSAFNHTNLSGFLINNNLTSIGDNAFAHCENLTSLTWDYEDSNLETIGAQAFSDCVKLKYLYDEYGKRSQIDSQNSWLPGARFPKDLESIGEGAFQNCSLIKEVMFESDSDLSKIGRSAFAGCTSLETLVLPKNLKTIEDSAFRNTPKLSLVVVNSTSQTPVPITATTFTSSASNSTTSAKLSVKALYRIYYSKAVGWKNFSFVLSDSYLETEEGKMYY